MIELAGHFFLRKKGAQQQMEFVEFVFLFCGGLWAARGHNAPQTKEDERTQTQHQFTLIFQFMNSFLLLNEKEI